MYLREIAANPLSCLHFSMRLSQKTFILGRASSNSDFFVFARFFIFSALLASFLCLQSCQKKEVAAEISGDENLRVADELEAQKSCAFEKYFSSLGEREKVSQIFVLNLEGSEKFSFVEYTKDGEERKPLVPGGYIFFGFNIAETPEKIAAFTDSVRDFARDRSCIEPFLCLDAEGGYVNRLRGIAGPLPECERVAQCLDAGQAQTLYSLNAIQLKSLGFDLNLAPVAESLCAENEKFLDGRSFGEAKTAAAYSRAAIRAYQRNRVGAVAKHFPGNNDVDPHLSLPRIFYDAQEFQKNVLEPFSAAIEEKPSGILMSHALVELQGEPLEDFHSADSSIPASLNPFWIENILRGKLGFDGIVFCDDIFMSALEKNGFGRERAVKSAILAGVNCILMSEKRFLNEYEIARNLYSNDEEFRKRVEDSARRIIKFKIECGILKYGFTEDGEMVLRQGSGNPLGEKNIFEERMAQFYDAREENVRLYEKCFLPTASREELRAVRID